MQASASTPGIAIPDAELKQWKLDRISKAGAHLMGRKTYEEMSSYWPQSDDPYAHPMNDIPKIVFSKTLDDDDASWPTSRVARGELPTEIAAIKAEPGPDVIAWGGAALCWCASGGGPDRRVPTADPAAGSGRGKGAVRAAARVTTPEPRRSHTLSQRHCRAHLPTATPLRRAELHE